jgi:hypothetical protein
MHAPEGGRPICWPARARLAHRQARRIKIFKSTQQVALVAVPTSRAVEVEGLAVVPPSAITSRKITS